MLVNQSIQADMLSNEDRFNDDFFSRFELRPNSTPLKLNDDVEKNYLFPTFYADASCAIAIFHCDFHAAKALLPNQDLEPVKMLGGRSLVIFSCYEYRNVMNVRPYNEIAMTIPVVTKGSLNLPVLSMLLGDKLENFGYYVFHMPVTSLENRIRGRNIWGLPKDVEHINIRRNQNISTTTASLSEEDDPYFTLRIPTQGNEQHFDVKSNLYSYLGKQRLRSTTQFKANFNVTKNMKTLIQKGLNNHEASLTLGSGPIADKLRSLHIEPTAFQYRHALHMNACFDLPHQGVLGT